MSTPQRFVAVRQVLCLAVTVAGYAALSAVLWWGAAVHLTGAIGAMGTVEERFESVLAVAAAGLAWLALTWFTLALVLGLLSSRPATSSRPISWAAGLLAPPLLRRFAAALLGASLAGTAGAVPALASDSPAMSVALRSTLEARRPPAADPVPDLDRPARPAKPRPAHATARPADPRGRGTVVVAPGDTLWEIASRALGREPREAAVRREWPRWYAANRRVVGPDPHLLRPGQRLEAPAPLRDRP